MSGLMVLVKRNTKLYFKDKGTFLTSMITPIILLVLYVTFLKRTFEQSFDHAFSEIGVTASDELVGGLVGGQLMSSLLAVCCITVTYCANLIMVQDKVTGVRHDFSVTPARPGEIALGYYISTLFTVLIVNFGALIICLFYLKKTGWYLSGADIAALCGDILLVVMFGTAVSSLINHFLSTTGQMSAVGTIVSAGYGFICGAYMPISSFTKSLRDFLSYMPSTYATSLFRDHALRGAFSEMEDLGYPDQFLEALKKSMDCEIKVSGSVVSTGTKYLIIIAVTALCIAL
ncbi:MAG: ABC transporter permease, partial [Anaerovoracaceae bacterium]